MGELFQRKPPKVAAPLSKAPPKTSQNPPPDGSDETLADIDKALGRVTIIHGSQEFPYDVAGKSIAYVREALGPILQVPKDAEAWVNNQPVKDETTLLAHNSTLEFIKASGVKG